MMVMFDGATGGVNDTCCWLLKECDSGGVGLLFAVESAILPTTCVKAPALVVDGTLSNVA